jgi:outer membrane immunogenic protein
MAVAEAADMPMKAAPPVPYSAAYNWTGVYAGGQVGWGWATSQATQLAATPSFTAGTVSNPTNFAGLLGGFYGGYNYQFNQFLVGIDGDYSFSDLTGTSQDLANTGNGHVANHSDAIKWIATATGRLGYANNNWLLFVKGGGAWAEFDGNSVNLTAAGALSATSSNSTTREGWIVGGGVEYGFASHWSAKLEYDYIKFDTTNFNSTDTAVAGAVTIVPHSATSSMNILKGGVAYRF